MSTARRTSRPATRRRRRWFIVVIGAALAVLVVAGAAAWWLPADKGSGGPPRLVLDRTEINLGYLRFETPAAATFVVTNTGEGPLQLDSSPPVKAVLGC